MLLWSIGIYDFGLTEDEFWDLTFAQFRALSKRHDLAQQQRDLGFGIVASVIANVNRDPKKRRKEFEPKDFMPVYEPTKPKKPKGEEMFQYWNNFVVPRFNARHARRVERGLADAD